MFNNYPTLTRRTSQAVFATLLTVAALQAHAAATIVIQNTNGAGVGFNDPTPAAPVGGNAGTTRGLQRLIAFQAAADIWGATLTSTQTIIIRASFEPLSCTTTSGTLGSAGAYNIWHDFPGAGFSNTWYPQALANKLSGVNQSAGDPVDGQDIIARFNSNLGQPGCLDGTFFYLGLDNNHGGDVDLVAVLLHEFGHGLGFQTFTSGNTGIQEDGMPSVWDRFLLDNTTLKTWNIMTDAERAASARNTGQLVWNGANVTNGAPLVLVTGTPGLSIAGPASGAAAGIYPVGTAGFGPSLASVSVMQQVMPVVDQPTGKGLACTPLSVTNARAVAGRVALIDRGTCTFVVKTKNAQNAGAVGVIIADNTAGSPPPGLGGADPTIVIPAVRVTLDDGNRLKAALATRSRTSSGVIATLGLVGTTLAGGDAQGHVQMFAPNPFQGGSSVSHYDTSATPNLLMEPSINGDLTHSVVTPQDLTFELLEDIGW